MSKIRKNIEESHAAPEYFYSHEADNIPLVSGNVILAVAKDRMTAYLIDFVLKDGSKARWVYGSKHRRDEDICNISVRLNETKN